MSGVDGSVLAGVPGAEDLVDAARTLAGIDPAALHETGADLAGVADGLVTTAGAVRQGSGGGAWSGPGADGYAAWAEGFAHTCADTEAAARASAGELGRLADALRAAEREVAEQVADAVSAASRVRLVAGADAADADSVRAAVAGPAAAARATMARVEQDLADAAFRLRAHTAALVGFSRLPAPDPVVAHSPQWAAPAGTDDDISAPVVPPPRGAPADDDLSAPLVPTPTGAAVPAVSAPVPAVPAPVPGAAVGDPVAEWIRRAREVLAAAGVPPEQMDPGAIATIIEYESGGDPGAVNGGDSNAARGTPSQGLMQTIGPTFDAYRLPGHGNIHDPVDNIVAGVRYAIDRYGSVSQVPGVVAVAQGRAYVGY